MTNLTKEEFLTHVKDHELTVAHDDGLYRHIILSKGGSFYDRFEIVTWPGYLSYSGDLGDFTFQRLEDMFKFFRGHEPNPSYWAEKLQAIDRHGGFEEFSLDIMREIIKDDFKYWEHENSEQRRGDWEDIQEELLNGYESEESAKIAIDRYVSPFGNKHFVDAWEWDLRDYTWRFMFACYAIPWAIGKYDEYRLSQAHSSHS